MPVLWFRLHLILYAMYLNLKEKLLIPKFDFSRGNQEVIESLTAIAVRMGFSRQERQGSRPCRSAIQRKFRRRKTKD